MLGIVELVTEAVHDGHLEAVDGLSQEAVAATLMLAAEQLQAIVELAGPTPAGAD